jgi:hypothetical protein
MSQEFVLLIIGAILPPGIDLINKYVKNDKWRFVISLVVCMVVGAIYSALINGFQATLADMTLVFASSQVIYKLIYANTAIQTSIRG